MTGGSVTGGFVTGGSVTEVDALIVGGGPSGLAAAVELRRLGASVIVLERDDEPGGIARHSDHLGYGLRDLRRIMRGPAYARTWTGAAERVGADIRVNATATGWAADGSTALVVTAPTGREVVRARTILLATGCRERSRSARLVPGTRPSGVFTTGSLQQLVHLHGARVLRRAVIVGAEHVSYSAALTIAHAGATTVAMVTEQPRTATFAAVDRAARLRYRFPLLTTSKVVTIHGRMRVERVTVRDLVTGSETDLACDAVVFTGDWVPDHELARAGAVPITEDFRGPIADEYGRTGRVGVFAAGNLLHGARTADACALEGRHVAGAMAQLLTDGVWPSAGLPIVAGASIAWVSPNRLATPVEGVDIVAGIRSAPHGALVLRQGRSELWVSRRRDWTEGRLARVAGRHLRDLDPMSGPLRVAIS